MEFETKLEIKEQELFDYTAKVAGEFQNGNEAAFDTLYQVTKRHVYHNIQRVIGSQSESAIEDLMQEIYVAVYTDLPKLRDTQAAYKWIKTLTRHKALDYYKKGAVIHEGLAGEDQEYIFETEDSLRQPIEVPEDILDNTETRRLVTEAVDALPEDQRAILTAFYYNETKITEIAKQLEMPENTVKTKLSRARKTLKERFEKMEKEQGIRLHSVSIVPFLLFLFGREANALQVPAHAETAVLNRVASCRGALGMSTGSAGGASAEGMTSGAVGTTGTVTGAAATGGSSGIGISIKAIVIAAVIGAAGVGAAGVAKVQIDNRREAERIEQEEQEARLAEQDEDEEDAHEDDEKKRDNDASEDEVIEQTEVETEQKEPNDTAEYYLLQDELFISDTKATDFLIDNITEVNSEDDVIVLTADVSRRLYIPFDKVSITSPGDSIESQGRLYQVIHFEDVPNELDSIKKMYEDAGLEPEGEFYYFRRDGEYYEGHQLEDGTFGFSQLWKGGAGGVPYEKEAAQVMVAVDETAMVSYPSCQYDEGEPHKVITADDYFLNHPSDAWPYAEGLMTDVGFYVTSIRDGIVTGLDDFGGYYDNE